jgi:hypothetical protein
MLNPGLFYCYTCCIEEDFIMFLTTPPGSNGRAKQYLAMAVFMKK